MGKDKRGFTIVIDSREQRPYRFRDAVVKALESGDYSIVGLEDRIAVERKSKEDAYSSLGKGRGRFERELERLSRFDYAALVIESDFADFLQSPPFTRMSPKAAMNSLVSWSVKYGIHVFFASDRRHARALVYRVLEKYWKHRSANAGEDILPSGRKGEEDASI
jgi:ERCC4-type nuclease